MSKIEVSTTMVSETTNELKVSVSSSFEHDVPEISDAQSAEVCIKLMVERHGNDEVYRLLKGQYTIALQAPARKELVEQWHSIAPDVRIGLIKMPEGEAETATAILPDAQRSLLQARMDEFRLGERAPRTRIVRITEDPIDAIARRIQSGEISGDELETMRARAMELLGLGGQRRR
jgi:hypothetical protein